MYRFMFKGMGVNDAIWTYINGLKSRWSWSWHMQYRVCNPIFTNIIMYSGGIMLGMGSANERRRYYVTSSFIGWAHSQKIPDLLHGDVINPYSVKKGSHGVYFIVTGCAWASCEDHLRSGQCLQGSHCGYLSFSMFIIASLADAKNSGSISLDSLGHIHVKVSTLLSNGARHPASITWLLFWYPAIPCHLSHPKDNIRLAKARFICTLHEYQAFVPLYFIMYCSTVAILSIL